MRWMIFLVLIACQPKAEKTPDDNSDPTRSTDATTELSEKTFDYTRLYGVYDHENTSKDFSAIVSLRQNGLDLYFTASTAHGSCKAETEGVIMMVEHSEQYYIGFANIENCPLQFTFYPTEKKVDIKEVSLCTIHGGTCSFEGVYLKRITAD